MAEKGEKRDPTSHRTPGQMKRKVNGYDKRPENRAKRSNCNKARRKLGLKVGDPRDADHIKPQREGGGNAKSNLRPLHRSKNRAWEAEKKKKATKVASGRSGKAYLAPGARKKSKQK